MGLARPFGPLAVKGVLEASHAGACVKHVRVRQIGWAGRPWARNPKTPHFYWLGLGRPGPTQALTFIDGAWAGPIAGAAGEVTSAAHKQVVITWAASLRRHALQCVLLPRRADFYSAV